MYIHSKGHWQNLNHSNQKSYIYWLKAKFHSNRTWAHYQIDNMWNIQIKSTEHWEWNYERGLFMTNLKVALAPLEVKFGEENIPLRDTFWTVWILQVMTPRMHFSNFQHLRIWTTWFDLKGTLIEFKEPKTHTPRLNSNPWVMCHEEVRSNKDMTSHKESN